MTALSQLADAARAWPFEEAKKLKKRLGGKTPAKGYVLFETGYGPSGLPHLGTFGEVARTTMVKRAFEALCPDIPTKLVAFSDDMDGLRKVPTNVPNQELLAQALDKPLTQVPDPFGEEASFAAQNNRRLQRFLDSFGFDYEFKSSTETYQSGEFDEALVRMAETYEKVMGIMLPTLGNERKATYSPFLPISPVSGKVLQVPMLSVDASAGTITYREPETGDEITQPVTGGSCKVQWKPDWALRWYALQVDYEMYGKDLIDSAKIAARITSALGGPAPEGFSYELFLDEQGQKISKSKGNGLSIEEWLEYGPAESLSLYMFQRPRAAKKLHFDVIPKAVDDYVTFLEKFPGEAGEKQLENPAWHIHGQDRVPEAEDGVSFGMLLNLASVVNADDPGVLWAFIQRYRPSAGPESTPFLAKLVDHAVSYYRDRVAPTKSYRAPTEAEAAAFTELDSTLAAFEGQNSPTEDLQTAVFTVGKAAGYENLREWFEALYQVLLGQDQGPRFGSFIALYGVAETRALLQQGIRGELAAGSTADATAG